MSHLLLLSRETTNTPQQEAAFRGRVRERFIHIFPNTFAAFRNLYDSRHEDAYLGMQSARELFLNLFFNDKVRTKAFGRKAGIAAHDIEDCFETDYENLSAADKEIVDKVLDPDQF